MRLSVLTLSMRGSMSYNIKIGHSVVDKGRYGPGCSRHRPSRVDEGRHRQNVGVFLSLYCISDPRYHCCETGPHFAGEGMGCASSPKPPGLNPAVSSAILETHKNKACCKRPDSKTGGSHDSELRVQREAALCTLLLEVCLQMMQEARVGHSERRDRMNPEIHCAILRTHFDKGLLQ